MIQFNILLVRKSASKIRTNSIFICYYDECPKEPLQIMIIILILRRKNYPLLFLSSFPSAEKAFIHFNSFQNTSIDTLPHRGDKNKASYIYFIYCSFKNLKFFFNFLKFYILSIYSAFKKKTKPFGTGRSTSRDIKGCLATIYLGIFVCK